MNTSLPLLEAFIILQKYSKILEVFMRTTNRKNLSNLDIIKNLTPIQPLPRKIITKQTSSNIICIYCDGDQKIRCSDAECYVCVMDNYCSNASTCNHCVTHYTDANDYCIEPTACERSVVTLPQNIKWSNNLKKVTCFDCLNTLSAQTQQEEDEKVNKILDSVNLDGVDNVPVTTKKNYIDGMNCKKCNTLNKYVTEANQTDGSYLCYNCRS